MKKSALSFMLVIAFAGVAGFTATATADVPLSGYWFECEYARGGEPPPDGCAILDDDGIKFDNDEVTHVSLEGGTERDACHKQREGQCFRADVPGIRLRVHRAAQIEKSGGGFVTVKVYGCGQNFNLKNLGDFYEISIDDSDGTCWWAALLMRRGNKYVRPYVGIITESKHRQSVRQSTDNK